MGASGLAVSVMRFNSHRGSFVSNLEQITNPLPARVNSASYPQWDWK